jgi:phosphoribosyl 1,2-cyclic phosphodiesterase
VKVSFCGVRGSVPVPDPRSIGYGGNTSCVYVELDDGSVLVLDAGTGIRKLGVELAGFHGPIHVLLTHLHLDHITGLMFFGPLFDPAAYVTVWGPPDATAPLRARLARYISAPLSPIEIRELPAHVEFRPCPHEGWRMGSAEVEAELVNHRGPTLGYRITEGDSVLAYIPDHEPALGQDLEHDDPEWISGSSLARGAGLLIHDAQYTEKEYVGTMGWGHSRVADTLRFARRAEVERLALFHHDPAHDDAFMDGLGAEARDAWVDGGGAAAQLTVAREGQSVEL